MLTPDGVIKVLDFGLAAVTQASGESPGDPDHSPTLTIGGTQIGTIMGTAAYMSPEQGSSKPVDRRADIWSFGVVLWEMLTGKRLFEGETISHTVAAVLTQTQDLQQVPMVAVAMRPDGSFGAPHKLFDRSRYLIKYYSYDVSPDGKRFLMIQRDPGSVPRQLNVILNWTQ